MRENRRRIKRRRRAHRPFLIDAEDFEFIDDFEMHDWMYGNPTDTGATS